MTNHNFAEAMQTNVNQLFFIVSYEIMVNKIKQQQLKR